MTVVQREYVLSADLAEAIRERNEIERQRLEFDREVFEYNKRLTNDSSARDYELSEEEIIMKYVPYIDEEVTYCRTDKGRYSVRPTAWACQFVNDRDRPDHVVISEYGPHLALFFDVDSAKKYIKLLERRRELESNHEL